MLTIYTINQLQHLDKELFERVNLQLIQLLVHYLQLILQPVDLVYDRSFTRLRHINIRHVTRGKRNLTLRTSWVLGNNFTSCSNGTLVICNSPSSSGSLFAISSASPASRPASQWAIHLFFVIFRLASYKAMTESGKKNTTVITKRLSWAKSERSNSKSILRYLRISSRTQRVMGEEPGQWTVTRWTNVWPDSLKRCHN
jgi:hypothetical protein